MISWSSSSIRLDWMDSDGFSRFLSLSHIISMITIIKIIEWLARCISTHQFYFYLIHSKTMPNIEQASNIKHCVEQLFNVRAFKWATQKKFPAIKCFWSGSYAFGSIQFNWTMKKRPQFSKTITKKKLFKKQNEIVENCRKVS